MSMMRWEPAQELLSLREAMNRLVEDSFIRPTAWVTQFNQGGLFAFPLDLYETENEIVVRASLPGVKPENLECTVVGGELTIKAETKEEVSEKEKNIRWHRQERRHGIYTRTLTLPTSIDSDKIEAIFEHGILTLSMPKSASVRPKTIKVKTVGEGSPVLSGAGRK